MLQAINQTAPNSSSNVLLEIEKTFGGHCPNVFKAYAEHPPLLAANWEKYKAYAKNAANECRSKKTSFS